MIPTLFQLRDTCATLNLIIPLFFHLLFISGIFTINMRPGRILGWGRQTYTVYYYGAMSCSIVRAATLRILCLIFPYCMHAPLTSISLAH